MPGGRPPKPLSLIKGHRTIEEKEIRKKAESELLTGTPLKENDEVKNNIIAHKEFQRVKKLLKSIKKDDDLSGNIINTHCLLHAECKEFEYMKECLRVDLNKLQKSYENKEVELVSYLDLKRDILSGIFSCDKKIMDKRKMILDISKENVMTIQSAMRSIPKKAIEEDEDPMAAFMRKNKKG